MMNKKNRLRYPLIITFVYCSACAASESVSLSQSTRASASSSATLQVGSLTAPDRAQQLLSRKKPLTPLEIDETVRALKAEEPTASIQILTTTKSRLERQLKALEKVTATQEKRLASALLVEKEVTAQSVELNEELIAFVENNAEMEASMRDLTPDQRVIEEVRKDEIDLLKSLGALSSKKATASAADWVGIREQEGQLIREKILAIDLNQAIQRVTTSQTTSTNEDDDTSHEAVSSARSVPTTPSCNTFKKGTNNDPSNDEALVLTESVEKLSKLMMLPKKRWLAQRSKEFNAMKNALLSSVLSKKGSNRGDGSLVGFMPAQSSSSQYATALSSQQNNFDLQLLDEVEAIADAAASLPTEVAPVLTIPAHERVDRMNDQLKSYQRIAAENSRLIEQIRKESLVKEQEKTRVKQELTKTENKLKAEREKLELYRSHITQLLDRRKSVMSTSVINLKETS